MIVSKIDEKNLRPIPEGWPVFMAHRGVPALAPENSLASFMLAKKLGARGIELDVHRCKSGELVVTHDHWLDRIAEVHRKIEDMAYDEIRETDTGSFFNRLYPDHASAAFSRERIPTLDAVLESAGADMYFDIELKSDRLFSDPLVAAVAHCLARHNRRNCIVSSFNPFALRAYRRCGTLATAAIYCPYKTVPFFMRHRECLYLSGADIKKPAYETVLSARRRETDSKPVMAWTVDSPAVAERLLADGVRTIITNMIQDFIQTRT